MLNSVQTDLQLISPDGQAIDCHKAILAAASEVLFNNFCRDRTVNRLPIPSRECGLVLVSHFYDGIFPEHIAIHVAHQTLQICREWRLGLLGQFLSARFEDGCGRARHGERCTNNQQLDLRRIFGAPRLCDATINLQSASTKRGDTQGVCEGLVVRVARVVLARESSFFESLFSTNWLESGDLTTTTANGRRPLCLTCPPSPWLTPTSLHRAIAAIHQCPYELDTDPLALLCAAHYLGFSALEEQVGCHMAKYHITTERVCEIWQVADDLQLEHLALAARKHIQEHFGCVCHHPAFVDLPFHLLKQVLECGSIQGNTQFVLEAVHGWAARQNIPSSERGVLLSQLLPPNTFLTREWKSMVLHGLPVSNFTSTILAQMVMGR